MTDSQTRELLPEVQAYITAKDEAERAGREAERALTAKYRDAHNDVGSSYYSDAKRELRNEHNREQDAAYQTSRIAINEAWNKLSQSSDPLVRWIEENCKEYQGYAIQVLKALPATLEELDALAEGEDWCNIWDQFRDRAVEAGVMPGYTPLSAARHAVFQQITKESCDHLGPAAKRRINALLDALLAEAAA